MLFKLQYMCSRVASAVCSSDALWNEILDILMNDPMLVSTAAAALPPAFLGLVVGTLSRRPRVCDTTPALGIGSRLLDRRPSKACQTASEALKGTDHSSSTHLLASTSYTSALLLHSSRAIALLYHIPLNLRSVLFNSDGPGRPPPRKPAYEHDQLLSRRRHALALHPRTK